MSAHPDHLYGFHIFKDLINETVLNIYAAGISAGEIPEKCFIWQGAFDGILRKNLY